jgi:hypothetical protein
VAPGSPWLRLGVGLEQADFLQFPTSSSQQEGAHCTHLFCIRISCDIVKIKKLIIHTLALKSRVETDTSHKVEVVEEKVDRCPENGYRTGPSADSVSPSMRTGTRKTTRRRARTWTRTWRRTRSSNCCTRVHSPTTGAFEVVGVMLTPIFTIELGPSCSCLFINCMIFNFNFL